MPQNVTSCAPQVLEVDPTNVKALYRRAQSYIGTLDYLEAELDLKRGLEVDPASTDLSALLKRLKVMQRAQNKKESQLYGRMFKGIGGAGEGAPVAAAADAAAPAAAAATAAPADTAATAAPAEEVGNW